MKHESDPWKALEHDQLTRTFGGIEVATSDIVREGVIMVGPKTYKQLMHALSLLSVRCEIKG